MKYTALVWLVIFTLFAPLTAMEQQRKISKSNSDHLETLMKAWGQSKSLRDFAHDNTLSATVASLPSSPRKQSDSLQPFLKKTNGAMFIFSAHKKKYEIPAVKVSSLSATLSCLTGFDFSSYTAGELSDEQIDCIVNFFVAAVDDNGYQRQITKDLSSKLLCPKNVVVLYNFACLYEIDRLTAILKNGLTRIIETDSSVHLSDFDASVDGSCFEAFFEEYREDGFTLQEIFSFFSRKALETLGKKENSFDIRYSLSYKNYHPIDEVCIILDEKKSKEQGGVQETVKLLFKKLKIWLIKVSRTRRADDVQAFFKGNLDTFLHHSLYDNIYCNYCVVQNEIAKDIYQASTFLFFIQKLMLLLQDKNLAQDIIYDLINQLVLAEEQEIVLSELDLLKKTKEEAAYEQARAARKKIELQVDEQIITIQSDLDTLRSSLIEKIEKVLNIAKTKIKKSLEIGSNELEDVGALEEGIHAVKENSAIMCERFEQEFATKLHATVESFLSQVKTAQDNVDERVKKAKQSMKQVGMVNSLIMFKVLTSQEQQWNSIKKTVSLERIVDNRVEEIDTKFKEAKKSIEEIMQEISVSCIGKLRNSAQKELKSFSDDLFNTFDIQIAQKEEELSQVFLKKIEHNEIDLTEECKHYREPRNGFNVYSVVRIQQFFRDILAWYPEYNFEAQSYKKKSIKDILLFLIARREKNADSFIRNEKFKFTKNYADFKDFIQDPVRYKKLEK